MQQTAARQPQNSDAAAAGLTLPPVAAEVDKTLLEIDEQVDWLMALSPLHSVEMWEHFVASGLRDVPEFQYQELDVDLEACRERLLALPIDEIEIPLIQALLQEKQREVDRQIELVGLRGTDGFIIASIDLFGAVEPELLECAEQVLQNVPQRPPEECDADVDAIVAAARDDFEWYQERLPGFKAQVEVLDDLHSMMMVHGQTMYLDCNTRIPAGRVGPLIAHEIGTHVLTSHNGIRQPLRQLESGLAHYEVLQEGLGALSEYLAGYLPPERLRIIAGRVVAADMALNGSDTPEIYHRLRDAELSEDDAFDTAVRAMRGGGFTKDAVYLRGLRELLSWLHQDGDLRDLYVGKFSLGQLHALQQLVDEGYVLPAELMPRHLESPSALNRLQRCRNITVDQLYQMEPHV